MRSIDPALHHRTDPTTDPSPPTHPHPHHTLTTRVVPPSAEQDGAYAIWRRKERAACTSFTIWFLELLVGGGRVASGVAGYSAGRQRRAKYAPFWLDFHHALTMQCLRVPGWIGVSAPLCEADIDCTIDDAASILSLGPRRKISIAAGQDFSARYGSQSPAEAYSRLCVTTMSPIWRNHNCSDAVTRLACS